MSEMLLLTSSIDPISEGQIFPENEKLPRHVTIWQYFSLPSHSVEPFIKDVGDVVEGFSPLEIVGTNREHFGPNNDVLVRRVMALGTGATLITLHTTIGHVIYQHEGIIENPEWAYGGYNPHMTFVRAGALAANEYAKLNQVELIEKDATTREKIVRKIWKLEEV